MSKIKNNKMYLDINDYDDYDTYYDYDEEFYEEYLNNNYNNETINKYKEIDKQVESELKNIPPPEDIIIND